MSLKKSIADNSWLLILIALGIGGFLLYKYIQANKEPKA